MQKSIFCGRFSMVVRLKTVFRGMSFGALIKPAFCGMSFWHFNRKLLTAPWLWPRL